MAREVLVIGGGAAGFFAAIAAAEALKGRGKVTLLEATGQVLSKVRISGGGRCNVTHGCFEPAELARRYPRGGRELLGAFHRWQPRDTLEWFAKRGVATKVEADGRMFPVTDDSATIVDCLERAARAAGVEVRLRSPVKALARDGEGFVATLAEGALRADRVILATGGGSGGGHALAAALGHAIEPPVPSLFTFHIAHRLLADLAGLSVEDAATSVDGLRLQERGPILVTHNGLSGPGILKLSAWGARELAAKGYRFTLRLSLVPTADAASVGATLADLRTREPRKQVTTWNPFGLPARLWERLVEVAGIPEGTTWANLGAAHARSLAGWLTAAELPVAGKSAHKEEFVTCGGVRLREVDFKGMASKVAPGLHLAGEVLDELPVAGKSAHKEEFVTCGGVRLREVDFKGMASKVAPGLHLAGEVLDIDGVTGGFNFQAAWTTGWLAGNAAAA